MNIAIQVTCLLIEAAESGIELNVNSGRLKIKTGTRCDTALRGRLREHQAAIVERLNFQVDKPNPFCDFFDKCCLFYAGKGVATPRLELIQTYRQWAKHNKKQSLSLVSLNKRLRMLGCEEILFHANPWWEHIAIRI